MERPSWKKRWGSYANKLLISYIVIVVVITSISGTFIYSSWVHSVKRQTEISIRDSLLQYKANVRGQMQQVSWMSDHLYKDQRLQAILGDEHELLDQYQEISQYLIPTLETALAVPSYPVWLNLYVRRPNFPEHDVPNRSGDPLAKDGTYEFSTYNRVADAAWFQASRDLKQSGHWSQVDSDKTFGNISFIRPLINYDRLRDPEIGVLRMTVKISSLFANYQSLALGKKGKWAVLDEHRHDLLGSEGMASALLDNPKKAGYLLYEEPIEETGWSIAVLLSASEVERDATHARNMTILFCLLSLVVMSLLSLAASTLFSKRVRKIVTSIQAFQHGEYHKRIAFAGNDEFADIAQAFNGMAGNIEELFHEVFLAGIEKKEAELEALQAQINPHFLYNTLSSINSLAQLGEKEKLGRMVTGLAKFYRLTLNSGKTMIPVLDEVEQVQAYISIQSIKYGEKLSVTYSIDPNLQGMETIKLILQPFVENALVHAWSGHRLHLRIVAEREEHRLVFKVIDDGVGMSPSLIAQVLEPAEAAIGYGVRNVDQRIKLHFGKEYGVEIASRVGFGTGVRITIPIVHEGE